MRFKQRRDFGIAVGPVCDEVGNAMRCERIAHNRLRQHGLRVTGQPTIAFSALHLSDDDLFRATHTIDLTPHPEVFLHIDVAQRGLGTLSCGPDTLPRYRLLEREYHFSFSLHLEGKEAL